MSNALGLEKKMNKDVKIFAIVGVILVLCMTGVFIYAIFRDAQWARTGKRGRT